MAPSPYRKTTIAGRTVQVHRVVYEREHGPIPDGYIVHHIDEDKRNNDPANLKAMTHGDHARLHNDKHPRVKVCESCGNEYEPAATKRERSRTCSRECFKALCADIVPRGSAAKMAKLDEQAVRVIRERVAAGERQCNLLNEYGISAAAMSMLVNRKTWTHVA